MDGPARPHVLSFDLRRGAPGAGLVAAGAETSHSPVSCLVALSAMAAVARRRLRQVADVFGERLPILERSHTSGIQASPAEAGLSL